MTTWVVVAIEVMVFEVHKTSLAVDITWIAICTQLCKVRDCKHSLGIQTDHITLGMSKGPILPLVFGNTCLIMLVRGSGHVQL